MDGENQTTFHRENVTSSILKELRERLQEGDKPNAERIGYYEERLGLWIKSIVGQRGRLTQEHLQLLGQKIEEVLESSTTPAVSAELTHLKDAAEAAFVTLENEIAQQGPSKPRDYSKPAPKPAAAPVAVATPKEKPAAVVLAPGQRYELSQVEELARAQAGKNWDSVQPYFRQRFQHIKQSSGMVSVEQFDSITAEIRKQDGQWSAQRKTDQHFKEAATPMGNLLTALAATRAQLHTLQHVPALAAPQPRRGLLDVRVTGELPARPRPAAPVAPRVQATAPIAQVTPPPAPVQTASAPAPEGEEPTPALPQKPEGYLTRSEVANALGLTWAGPQMTQIWYGLLKQAAFEHEDNDHQVTIDFAGKPVDMHWERVRGNLVWYVSEKSLPVLKQYLRNETLITPPEETSAPEVTTPEKPPAVEKVAEPVALNANIRIVSSTPALTPLARPGNYLWRNDLAAQIGIRNGIESTRWKVLMGDLEAHVKDALHGATGYVQVDYQGHVIDAAWVRTGGAGRPGLAISTASETACMALFNDPAVITERAKKPATVVAEAAVTPEPIIEAEAPAPITEPEHQVIALPPESFVERVASSAQVQERRRAQVDNHLTKNRFFSAHAQLVEQFSELGLQPPDLKGPLALLHMKSDDFAVSITRVLDQCDKLKEPEALRASAVRLIELYNTLEGIRAVQGKAA